MMPQQRLYPIGIQTFSEIRRKNYLYIDKTEYMYRMQAHLHGAEVRNFVNFDLSINFPGALHNGAALVGCDSIQPTAERNQLHQLHILLRHPPD